MMNTKIKHHKSRAFELKLIGYEDILVGIILGILIVAYSALYFTLPNIEAYLPIALIIFIVLAIFDIFHEIKTISQDLIFTILALISNLIEIFVSLIFISKLYNLVIPFATNFVYYLEDPFYIMIAGLFFVIVNLFWFYAYHFMK